MFANRFTSKVLNYFSSITVILLIIGIVGCSDDESEPTVEFDRATLLNNIGNNIILPSFDDFQQQTEALNATVSVLAQEVNQQNLDAAQTAWLSAASAWKKTEMFDLGPIDQLNVKFDIQNYPVNVIGVEDEIETNETFTQDYVEALATNRKGVSTIEYLLFDLDNGDAAVLNLLTTDTKRLAYLSAIAENLASVAGTVNEGWQATGGNYLATFLGSTGTSAASSVNVLANEMIMLIEEIKNEKIGVPLGKKSMGVLLPDNVEARFSGLSRDLILANLISIEQVFKGQGTNGDMLGYADYLDAVNAEFEGEALSSVILTEINTLRAHLTNIDGPIQEAIESDVADVEAAYVSSQRIVRLVKTDMINALALTVTFTDNDGD